MFELQIKYRDRDIDTKDKDTGAKNSDIDMREKETGAKDKEVDTKDRDANKKEGKVTISPINILKKTIDCLLNFVEEVYFNINDSGIQIQRLDSMNVVLADILLSNNLFDSYRCDRNLVLGVNLKSFYGILKEIHLENDSMLVLHCHDDSNHLTITHKSNTYNLSFNIKLFSYNIETLELKKQNYSAFIDMGTEKFLMLSKVVGSFSEFLEINAKNDTVTFMQKGEMADSTMVLRSNVEGGAVISVAKPVIQEIAMKYVKYMSKAAALTQKVTIHMGENTPLYFDFYLYNMGHMKFYIAPKARD